MANFETVGLIGPRSEQREPKEKKKDIWDRIKDGLDIANGALGIGVNYSTWEKNRAQLAALEDSRNGVLTKAEELDYFQKGLDKAQPGADGKFPAGSIEYKTRQGEDTPTSAFVRAQKKEKPLMGWVGDGKGGKVWSPLSEGVRSLNDPPKAEKPTMGWVSSRDKDGTTTKVWGPLTPGTTSVEEPLPKADKPEGTDLPIDQKTEVTKLSGANTDQRAIRNQIAAYKEQFDKAATQDEKIRIGRQMIKALNSLQGSDAVGVDEVKRLSEALEYQLFNFTGPGKAFGRDLEGFGTQVDATLGVLDSSMKANQERIDQLMGRGITSEYKPGQVIKLKDGRSFKVGPDGHSLEEIKGQ